MEENYHKAYKEVIEILKYVPQESVNKIPKTMLETFEKKMDKDYVFNVDINKSFEEQNLLEETKDIFAVIFRDYWATPYQRERIKEKEKYDRQKIEEEKANKYNPDDIFNKKIREQNKENIKQQNEEQTVNNLPVEYKEKFYLKIIKILKNIFLWRK